MSEANLVLVVEDSGGKKNDGPQVTDQDLKRRS